MQRQVVFSLLVVTVSGTLGVSGSLVDDLVSLGFQAPGQRRDQPEPQLSTKQACTSKTVLTGKSGVIVSPGIGGAGYSNNTRCTWIIKTAPSNRIKLYIDLVDIDCESMAVLDVDDTRANLTSTKICDDKIPRIIPIFSYTNELTVLFTSPIAGNSEFRLRYISIPKPECGVPFVRPLYSLDGLNSRPIQTTEPTTEPTTEQTTEQITEMLTTTDDLPENPMLGIVGGEEANPHSWPWIITLTYFDLHMCGAVLLNNDWAVTAAHCVDSLWTEDELLVEVGRHTSTWMVTGTQKLAQTVSIRKFIVHENYDSETFENDIALIALNETITYNAHVQPVCLSHRPPVPGKMCVVTGWGVTKGTADETVLNQAVVPTVAQDICRQDDWYGYRLYDTQFCAGYEEGIKDSCTGDSGGPLVCPTSRGTWELVGLTSWGDDCGEPKKPGVYTRVDMFLDWIEEHSNYEIET